MVNDVIMKFSAKSKKGKNGWQKTVFSSEQNPESIINNKESENDPEKYWDRRSQFPFHSYTDVPVYPFLKHITFV